MGTQVASAIEDGATPPVDLIIKTEDLWKTYDMGQAVQVNALCGITFEI